MNIKIVSICVLVVFFVGLASSFAGEQFIDVVRLKDGTTLLGVVVDQNVGVSLKLVTADGLVYTLEDGEIKSVRKRKIDQPIPFSFKDVVMLKDGVVFRGMIVEQQPAKSIVLQTENEVLLTFKTEEIWKILKEKQISGVSLERQQRKAQAEREGVKLQFQIERTRKQLWEKEGTPQGRAEVSGDLESEINRLNDEIMELESAQQEAEHQVVDEHRSEERDKIEELHGAVEKLIEELLEMLDQCEESVQSSASARGILQFETAKFLLIPPKPLGLKALSGFGQYFSQDRQTGIATIDVTSTSEMRDQAVARLESSIEGLVNQTLQKLPTQEEIDALHEVQQARVQLSGLLQSGQWRRVMYRPELDLYVTQLSIEDRLFLYDTHKRRDQMRGVMLNIFPFLYLGCWAQGDWVGALVGYAVLAGSLALAGYLEQVQLWFYAPAYSYGFIEPFLFTYLRNSRMKRNLQVDAASIRQERRKNTTALSLPVYFKAGEQRDFEVHVDLVSFHY
jgi:hypothetical protein